MTDVRLLPMAGTLPEPDAEADQHLRLVLAKARFELFSLDRNARVRNERLESQLIPIRARHLVGFIATHCTCCRHRFSFLLCTGARGI